MHAYNLLVQVNQSWLPILLKKKKKKKILTPHVSS